MLKGGDYAAFEEIVGRYKKPVLNMIYRNIGNTEDAEDLAQEAFVRVYKARDSYEPKAKFSTWLFRIAHNRLMDHFRAQGLGAAYPGCIGRIAGGAARSFSAVGGR